MLRYYYKYIEPKAMKLVLLLKNENENWEVLVNGVFLFSVCVFVCLFPLL